MARAAWTLLLGIAIGAQAAHAADDACKSCWNATCPELKDAGLPKCAPPKKKEPPPPPPPPVNTTTPAECTGGKVRNGDTAGHCCWQGQAWAGTKCVGAPTSCPEFYNVDTAAEQCTLPACDDGMQRAQDGVHCCWPGQGFSSTQKMCIGKPSCPSRFVAEGDTCLSPSKQEERRIAERQSAAARAAQEAQAQADRLRAEQAAQDAETARLAAEAQRLAEERAAAEQRERYEADARAQAAEQARQQRLDSELGQAQTTLDQRRQWAVVGTALLIDTAITGVGAAGLYYSVVLQGFDIDPETNPLGFGVFLVSIFAVAIGPTDALIMAMSEDPCSGSASIYSCVTTPLSKVIPGLCCCVSAPEGRSLTAAPAPPGPSRLVLAPDSSLKRREPDSSLPTEAAVFRY